MVTAGEPGRAFAIADHEQYRPARTLGHQRFRVREGPEAAFLLCHASPLVIARQDEVDHLLVVVHGALRDCDRYFDCAVTTATAGQIGSRTLVVAPQFLADVDVAARHDVPDDVLRWNVEGWKGGADALGPVALSSFAVMDSLLHQLTRPDELRNRRPPAVILFGNSAGGQFVNRYAAVGREPDALAARGIPVRFVVANPSSYLYFSPDRPVPVDDDSRVNHWRYGFDGAPEYVRDSPEQCLRRYLARDVTVVLGTQDNDRAAVLLEVSPPAMAQGTDRLDRGIRYEQHVRGLARISGLPVRHRYIQLPGVGHDAGAVLLAAQTRDAMFK